MYAVESSVAAQTDRYSPSYYINIDQVLMKHNGQVTSCETQSYSGIRALIIFSEFNCQSYHHTTLQESAYNFQDVGTERQCMSNKMSYSQTTGLDQKRSDLGGVRHTGGF